MPEIDPAKKEKIALMAERIYKLGQSDKTGFEKLKDEVKNLKTKVKDLQTELKNTKSGSSSELVKLASKVTKKLESGEDSTELRDVKLIANSFAIKETVTTTDVDKLIEKLSLIRSKVAKPAKAKKEAVAQPA